MRARVILTVAALCCVADPWRPKPSAAEPDYRAAGAQAAVFGSTPCQSPRKAVRQHAYGDVRRRQRNSHRTPRNKTGD